MRREAFYTAKFQRDVKAASKRGLALEQLRAVMTSIEADQPLNARHRAHPLTGNYVGYMECHIQPDWLLIYLLEPGRVTFVRTGTHSDLF